MWVFVSNFNPLKLKLIAKLSNAYFRLFDSNMLINNITTVICLDDYHSLDRTRRRKKEVMMLDPRANDFELMLDPIPFGPSVRDGMKYSLALFIKILISWRAIGLNESSGPPSIEDSLTIPINT
ncbi:hypothetical protein DVH24_025897 [Malus domestica]|uniref:Phosphoribulokinase/uridine kinase domain-containing protein n=1 Tax=Malus domestica TaxID=3750 RepID=A0A498KHW8_MALDO|nr:hypothetical protein DVH24_025897 [Malus domestica]